MKKKPSIRSLKKKAWGLFSRYIRLRDCLRTTGSPEYGECFSCDASLPFNQLQAGHFIAGRHHANLFSERGVQAQCRVCNIVKHGQQLEFRRQLIKLYGEGVDGELEDEANQIVKFTREDYEEKIEYYTNKIKELSC